MNFGKMVVGCGLWLMANLLCFADTQIYLTAQANRNPWPGTVGAPFYAGNAAAFTAILVTNNLNCTFHYAAGTYQTLGYYWRQRATANLGCKHFGAGIDKTIIQLVGAQFGPEGVIFGADSDQLKDGFEVHDLTLDCNAVHNARYTNGFSACTAVLVGGCDILIDGVKIIGFGTARAGMECAPVYVCPQNMNAAGRTNIHNTIVQHCIFTAPAPTNAEAVSCCTVAAAPGFALSNNVIRFCSVSNVASHFPDTHTFCAPLVEHCVVDTKHYIEPGWLDDANRDWIIRSNVFKNVKECILVGFGPGRRVRSLTVEGNLFLLAGPPARAFGYSAPDPPQGEGFDWLILRNNTVIATNGSNFDIIGFNVGRASQVVIESNRMVLPFGRGLQIDSVTTTSRWFSANIDGGRSPLGVTNWVLGSNLTQSAATRWKNVKPPAVSARIQSSR